MSETLEAVFVVAPMALERARRLEFAIKLCKQGLKRREISGQVRRQFDCSKASAWRIMDMAWDMAGEVKHGK